MSEPTINIFVIHFSCQNYRAVLILGISFSGICMETHQQLI